MAEGNASGGGSKLRSALGDLTNRIGKRECSGREKNGVKFNDKDVGKRICVGLGPRPCSEINSLKGNVISGLSKIPNENRDPNVLGLGSGCAVPKSSRDVYDGSDNGHCLKKKSLVIGNSNFRAGDNDIKISDLMGGNVVPKSVNELDNVDNDLVSCGQIECSSGEIIDKVPSQNHVDQNLADLERGKALNSIPSEADGRSKLELDMLKENKISGTSAVENENKCPIVEHSVKEHVVDLTVVGDGDSVLGSSEMRIKENDPNLLNIGRSGTIQSISAETNDELGDSLSADTSKTVSEMGNECLHDGKSCDAGEVKSGLGGTQSDTKFCHNDLDDHNAENFVLSQSGSIDCTILPESQESRVLETDRSTKLKEDEAAHMTFGTNSIRACSCSFCTQAAHIWLDLHHKDIKARISALKKSQKDASIFAEKSCRIKVHEKHGAESVTKVSKLESHLMHQWRSLFQQMSKIWDNECNQLEASLLPLNNLREKCKADLEFINPMPSEKR